MILTEVKIHNVRNIVSAHLVLHPKISFISGANGSGKTSLLESLYLLSCGHSFRSREIAPIITQGQSALTVFARSQYEDMLSIQKSSNGPTQIKLNNQYCSSTSQIAYALPCQVFYSDIFHIIDAGPSVRRSLLDWGLFHVKHNYLFLWKEYKKVLRHRNVLLKKHAPYSHFIPWDKQLSHLAKQLDSLREEYFSQLQLEFSKVLTELANIPCSIGYFKGWDKKQSGKDLEELLKESFSADLQKSYTQYGPHQADIIIQTKDTKAKLILSRGQQKIILIALKLAQANLLNKDCLYLIDDLTAELDETHQEKLLSFLIQRKGQYIITSTSLSSMTKHCSVNDYSSYLVDNGIFCLSS